MHATFSGEKRGDRRIQERNHDPYRARFKLPEPTVCPECSAVFLSGRWQWADPVPFTAHYALCQACRRIADQYPAGIVTISGEFARTHRQEIINLVRHLETLENELHPLHRIMKIERANGSLVVNTTDMHLARRIGEALRRAHKGDLEIRHPEEAGFVRVNWWRET